MAVKGSPSCLTHEGAVSNLQNMFTESELHEIRGDYAESIKKLRDINNRSESQQKILNHYLMRMGWVNSALSKPSSEDVEGVKKIGTSEYRTPPGVEGHIGHYTGEDVENQYTVDGVTHVTARNPEEARKIAEGYNQWLDKNSPKKVAEGVSGREGRKVTKEDPQATLDLGKTKPPVGRAEPMITPAGAKTEAEPEVEPVEKEERVVKVRENMHALPKHSRWIGPGDKRNWRQGLSKVNKEGEREEAPEEDKPSWALDPNGYRFRVNQFYRENKVPLSLAETANKTMNHIQGQISEARRAKDSEKVASLTNKKERVWEKLAKDLKTLKGRLKPRAIEAEHKKLIEAVIKETKGGGPEASQKRSLLNKEALKAYGLEIPKAKDISSEQLSFLQEKSPESREGIFDALRNAGMSKEDVDKLKEDLSTPLPTIKNIVEDHYGKFKVTPTPKDVKDLESLEELKGREPLKRMFADTEKDARAKIRKELKEIGGDMGIESGSPEFEKEVKERIEEWKRSGKVVGHARGYTDPQSSNRGKLKRWVRGIRNKLLKHRNDIFDGHGIPVEVRGDYDEVYLRGKSKVLGDLTKDQRDLVLHVAAAEKKVKKRLIRALRGDAPKGRKETPADVSVAKFAAGTTTGISYPAESAGIKAPLGKLGRGISTPVFDALDEEGQQEIIELLKKSVNTEEPSPTDTLMPGLFLNIALFKALTVSEEQKIQAFKNSFGAGTSGVGPATMNTVGIGERDKDKDEDDDDDKTKKSLNLGFYIRC